jgi:CRP-like cAMP-binding protein
MRERTMSKVIVDHLKRVSLFANCSDKQLAQIAKLTTGVRVGAGHVVARQGEVGHEFVVIVDGTATVTIDGATVAHLGPGEFFGEIALLDGGRRTASVTADTDLVIEVLTAREFASLLADVPGITLSVLKGIAARLRATDRAIVS